MIHGIMVVANTTNHWSGAIASDDVRALGGEFYTGQFVCFFCLVAMGEFGLWRDTEIGSLGVIFLICLLTMAFYPFHL